MQSVQCHVIDDAKQIQGRFFRYLNFEYEKCKGYRKVTYTILW